MRTIIIFFMTLVLMQFLFQSCGKAEYERKINKTQSGYIKSVGDSVNNKRDGEWIICSGLYKEKVDTIEIRQYKDGKLNGICQTLGTNKNWIFVTWKNGLKHGSEYEILNNGDSLFRGKWINNLPIGAHTLFYYNEQVNKEFRPAINDGDLFNTRRVYMGNRISRQCNYNKKGELEGDYVEFDNTGILTVYGRFKSGKKIGIWLEKDFLDNYYKIYELGNYKNDKKDGKWISYKQHFNYQISEYEPNDVFFKSFRKKIKKKDITSEITYSNGVKIKELYYFDGKTFNSQEEFFNYRFPTVKSENNDENFLNRKKSTFSY